MDADWTTSPGARRVLQHADDSRPAWLWSQDGAALLWHNDAADLFLAKLKKHGLKRAAPAVPIKGQVSRTIRMGSAGRTSLARIQFLAGDKPASATCAATPLTWTDGSTALLIVAVDPIADDILAAARPDEAVETEPQADLDAFAADEATEVAEAQVAEEPSSAPLITDDIADWDEPKVEHIETSDDAPSDVSEEARDTRLTRLFDQLSSDEDLFTPLTEADDTLRGATDAEAATAAEPEAVEPAESDEPPAVETDAPPAAADAPALYRVTGRGLSLDADETDAAAAQKRRTDEQRAALEQALSELSPRTSPDTEAVERVSRYNFDELSRILTDRVGENARASAPPPPSADIAVKSGSLVNLGGETLVLNRLPLGILVFRDQQVMFANRAITEMVGYDSVESLRQAGLAAVFPAAGPDGQEAGPVNHLVQRDGTLVPVTARLQSISWQGRPALMLSASTTEVRTGHEGAVRAFAMGLAELRGDGFVETNRAGVVSAINDKAVSLLAQDAPVEGKPLSALISASDGVTLREFLERPARFAETARPALVLRSTSGRAEISLFAQGQAGVVTGYFGLVRGRDSAPAQVRGTPEADPALLARISRGVRRPLNTIIGFSDLIRSEAFGAIQNERYEGYANDIATAGQEIAALVDELDDYARLRDGRYLPQRASVDISALLESCVIRIRQQANGARVIVRNAISESLPKVTADQASLGQAVLNLLASAIDQTPTGGAVVISAQREDDGGIAIHVRDSSNHGVDMAERFVVFRDGVGRNGQAMTPIRSSVGLALTRSLLAVNTVSLSVDPAGDQGMLFSLRIPANLVEQSATPQSDT